MLRRLICITVKVYRPEKEKIFMKLLIAIRRLYNAIISTSKLFLAVELPLIKSVKFKKQSNAIQVP